MEEKARERNIGLVLFTAAYMREAEGGFVGHGWGIEAQHE